MQIYLVGGAVRDKLLNIPVKDRDWVVVGATVEQMLDAGYQQVGRDFPVFLHPQTKEEYALARTERKSGKGYTGFQVHASPEVTLEEDLLRRDLSINAMAEDKDGNIIDPYGGIKDIQSRTLRHVSPAFSEDPLRVLRVARFAARYAGRGFIIADDTMALMKQLTDSGELEHLVAERVWHETAGALREGTPTMYFETLRECGALAMLFPEVDRLFGVPQSPLHHPEIDTGVHTMMVLQQAARLSPYLTIRFAALCHDLGKGVTPESEWPHHPGHEENGIALLEPLAKRLRVPNDCLALARLVMLYHGKCHQVLDGGADAEKTMYLLEKTDAFRQPKRFREFLLACQADYRGRTGYEDTDYPQAEHLGSALDIARAIGTRDIVAEGFSGPAIGGELRRRRLRAIADQLT